MTGADSSHERWQNVRGVAGFLVGVIGIAMMVPTASYVRAETETLSPLASSPLILASAGVVGIVTMKLVVVVMDV